ncbi:ATP-dependent 6-phosphofructokinase [Williamwhitmania taraxaci]|uniref:ATP-dependent 6-phosphofructokinase n=1 Tax=Williamwhitmania taraxaci TaxID=1640674 RepID=A0A1G6PVY1_9BACT|nr:ATP-dependent 6-phosphofructokinase [Williamwhitmania taraxaci]SDC83535.1 6-phosphofructokinase [Williamwhitmania taraxaci]
MTHDDFKVKVLGRAEVKSKLTPSSLSDGTAFGFIENDDRVLINTTLSNYKQDVETSKTPISFEIAGPHEYLYFNPSNTKVAIVTCGGLCPGVNNVIQSVVNQLYYRYKVKQIVGIRYGYEGFIAKYNHQEVELTPQSVDKIHFFGGTVLGTSRGDQDIVQIVDRLSKLNINILFCIGGDGTLRGAHAIHQEIHRRNLNISVAGIPKTIDNDINFIDKSFGFETAFTIANDIIRYAHNEAIGAYNGIAIVKLMGRNSGFIAAHAALSVHEVNLVLIPEMAFDMDGSNGFLNVLQRRLENRHHALIVVAEGAGQHFFDSATLEKDASGNIKNKDIGLFLKEKITEEFEAKGFPFVLKYIDPSYIIRSAPANANDSKFCGLLAQNAVHAAMAGKTDFVVGHWNSNFTLLPIPISVSKRKEIDVEGELWWNVIETTGQPASMKKQ